MFACMTLIYMANLPQLGPLRRDSIHTRLFSQLFVHPDQFKDLYQILIICPAVVTVWL